MAHRPYPNRDRARRQVDRGRAPQDPAADVFAYLQSEECRQKTRELATRLNTLFLRVTVQDRSGSSA